MVNYIRAEFYKVFRRRYTWITLVVLLALTGLIMFVYRKLGGKATDMTVTTWTSTQGRGCCA